MASSKRNLKNFRNKNKSNRGIPSSKHVASKKNKLFLVLVIVFLIFSSFFIWFFFFNSSEEIDLNTDSDSEIQQSEMVENKLHDEYYHSVANMFENNYYCQYIVNLERKKLCMNENINYFEPIKEDFG